MKLSDIQEAADKKYAPLGIELDDRTVELRTPIRLSKEDRAKLQAATKAEEQEDPIDTIEGAFRIVIADNKDAEALIKAIDGDLGVALELFKNFNEGSQSGEASSSES
ncbi:MAG: phage tail assembly protein [Brevibacterium aurantiacum]|nr:phage tail assembly protein [Brevibacterium aurantiacum]